MEQVERDLMATLERLMREETWQPLSADLPVLKSSNELVRVHGRAAAGRGQGRRPRKLTRRLGAPLLNVECVTRCLWAARCPS